MRASSQQLLATVPREGPLYLQIYHRMRGLILTGTWRPGTKLPSSRSVARDLGVSRNTALLALEKLIADGWVHSRAGSGMFVSADAPPARPYEDSPLSTETTRSFEPVPFEISEAATDIFDTEKWSKIQREVWTKSTGDALHEGAVAGWPPLRSAISAYLNAVRGVVCSPDQVFIVSGTQAALDLCVRVLSGPGDEIWIENPGYPYARATFALHGLTQVPVPVDDQGIVVREAKLTAPNAKLAYVTPACQFPTCTTLSPERRDELTKWARTAQGYIIEDDWDFSAAFDNVPAPEPMAASDDERTLLIHSFNRILFPALRIAALVVPKPLINDFVDACFATARFQNVSNQIALAHFIDRGLLSAHLRRLKQVCGERRTALAEGIQRHLWRWVYTRERQPGHHTLAWVRSEHDTEMASAARAAGVACVGLNDFVVGPSETAGALVLGFAAFQPEEIEAALQQLATALSRHH